MGFLPREPLIRDDTKGGNAPFGIPHIPYRYLCFLRILPRLCHKNHVSASTKRNMSLFERPAAEVSSIDPPQIR